MLHRQVSMDIIHENIRDYTNSWNFRKHLQLDLVGAGRGLFIPCITELQQKLF